MCAQPSRLWSRLFELGRIGARIQGDHSAGIDRQALSDEDIAARKLLISWACEAGLEPAGDTAGNLFFTLQGTDRDLPPVLTGSHIDSQPSGGLFDGSFGTLAALEAASVLAAEGPPRRSLRVVAWMNEEGSRFAPGMMGSALFAGARRLSDVRAITDSKGITVGSALDRLQTAFVDLPKLPLGGPVHVYVESHIEQADRLETAGVDIGVVTGIQGKITWEVTLSGREAHAGTEPMETREDALQAFVRCANAAQHRIGSHDLAVRFTIGRLTIKPNAPSVVPSSATFRIDLRHPDAGTLTNLADTLEKLMLQQAAPCGIKLTRLAEDPPNTFDTGLQTLITDSARALGVSSMPLMSAAGHDARFLSRVAPSAMIFIPCRGGVSHHPDEWVEPHHVDTGLRVLIQTLRQQLN